MYLKRVVKFIVVIGSLILLTFVGIKYSRVSTKVPDWSTERTIRYAFTLENKTSEPLVNSSFKTYSPLELTSTQKLINIESTHEFKKIKDTSGNQVLEFNVPFMPPYGKKRVLITAELLLSEVAAGGDPSDLLYTSELQPLIEVNDRRVKNIASQFDPAKKSVYQDVFDWLVENIEYTGYGQKDKGAAFAAEFLEGDCTEFAYLNVAINRILNIPSRAVNGYVVTHDSKLNTSDFHTWNESWIDQAWQVTDAQMGNFLENQHTYIAMNVVDDIGNSKNFKKFWVSNPDLTVTMN